jgi:O-Antigen ligase
MNQRFIKIYKTIIPEGKFPHRSIYIFGIAILAASLPLSIFTTSVAEIILVANWLIERNFSEKWNIIQTRKSLLLIISVYIIHVIWLINTSDFNYAFHDLRIKLPILVLPVVIGTTRALERIQLKWILVFYASAVLAGTLMSAAVLFNLVDYQFNDVRQISLFIDHIRFSLLINIAIFSLLYILISREFKLMKWEYIIYSVVASWLMLFLVMLQALTGLLVFMITAFLLFWINFRNIKHVVIRWTFAVFMITAVLIVVSFVTKSVAKFYTVEEIDRDKIDKLTVNGNPYNHDFSKNQFENGKYVWLFLCEKELQNEWNKRSNIAYDGKDLKGHEIKYTIIRYMTSKGLRKDSVGVSMLTNEDIRLIENGNANYIYGKKLSLYPKLYEVLWQIDVFRRGENPSGHSVTQRILYLQAGIGIIKQHFLFGTGTGDVRSAFSKYYDETGSKLDKRWRLRAHNQYVTFFLTFGIFGFLWIMFSLIYPPFLEKKWKDYFFVMFFIIGFLSMLNEDTLETHIGNSFFSFFYALFLLGVKNRPSAEVGKNETEL